MVLSVISFFFFKQKTAYEMRISDWSSDVCSSDLAESTRGTRSGWLGADLTKESVVVEFGKEQLAAIDELMGNVRARNLPFPEIAREDFSHQIGRASCRERVCQYV